MVPIIVVVLVAVIVTLAAIGYVWRSVSTGAPTIRNRQPGAVLDANSEVRQVDLGVHTYVAQQAHAELTAQEIQTRVVEFEEGAIGIGMGMHYFLVYNAADEVTVLAAVDKLLAEVEGPAPWEPDDASNE